MEFLPRTLGTRPRLACELRTEGVVAARADDASGVLVAVARAPLAEAEASVPAQTVAGLRKVLEAVALRTREATLIVPDSAARVLLLDFDALPSKAAEALPILRFRLKKLLPFDADDAAVSYQVMAATKGQVRVVAVAMPREVLASYEAMVREAGFEPGAILPSTLAALAGLGDDHAPALVVNASRDGVTTAIVQGGVLLLHRSIDLRTSGADDAGGESVKEEWGRTESPRLLTPLEASSRQTAVLDRVAVLEQDLPSAWGEIAQTVSVTAAYFEDTLEAAPGSVLSAGTLGATTLAAALKAAGVGPVPVLEMVDRTMLGETTTALASVPLGWLAGVRGALRS